MSDITDVMKTWFERVWANEDDSAIDEMLVEDTHARGLGAQPHVGPEEFKVFHRALLQLVGNVRVTIDKSLIQDDWASMLITLRATSRDGKKPIEISGHVFARVEGNVIHEAYNHIDFMLMFEQLDLMPDKTFERCLTCQKLT